MGKHFFSKKGILKRANNNVPYNDYSTKKYLEMNIRFPLSQTLDPYFLILPKSWVSFRFPILYNPHILWAAQTISLVPEKDFG